MAKIDIRLKKLYDSMADMITNLHLQKGNISREEMYFLLSLLDYVFIEKSDPSLIEILQEWQNCILDHEINEIIKATLMNIDFKKPDSIAKNMEIISSLIRYNDNLGET